MSSSKELQDSLDQAFDLVEEETVQEGNEAALEPTASSRSAVVAASATAEAGFDADIPTTRLPQYLGIVLMLASVGLAAVTLLELVPPRIAGQLTRLGLSPALLFVAGVLMAALGWLQSMTHRRATSTVANLLGDEFDVLRDDLAQLASDTSSANANATSVAAFEEIQALHSKQEGMISNLTKAVRMHNKPLVDLVGMITDISKQSKSFDDTIVAIKLDLEAIEKAVTEDLKTGEKKWEGMVHQFHSSADVIEQNLDRHRDKLVERLEPQIIDESRRLQGELETQWELARESFEKKLGELETNTRDEMQALGRQLQSPGSGGAAELDALQKSIAGLQTAIRALEQRITDGSAPVTATPVAPTPVQPAAEPSPVPSNSGTTSSGGGKVLSAIERLKQMRGS